MGDPRVAGPSLYWIDSVVELTPGTASDLKQRYQPAPSNEAPDVWNTLRGSLPTGGYLTSPELDAAFTSTKIKTKAFLAEHDPIIVLTAVGE
ncbi:hypothetical protein AWC31_12350 [Mycolicibacterium wolinskyi]|uniref:Uncharacterized protein n=2 Tax=Mycobacteriaceae TaxID=1762 RepID=A0A1X2FJY4_9MYCO|nr:hypothetical protein AWC31_12350 [Mycolicibacterium wolinskyi]